MMDQMEEQITTGRDKGRKSLESKLIHPSLLFPHSLLVPSTHLLNSSPSEIRAMPCQQSYLGPCAAHFSMETKGM